MNPNTNQRRGNGSSVPDWQRELLRPGQSVSPQQPGMPTGQAGPYIPPAMGSGGGQRSGPGLPLPVPVVIAIAVVVVAAALWFLFFRGSGGGGGAANTSGENSKATPLNSLNATLAPPSDKYLSAFLSDASSVSYFHSYFTKNSTDKKACSLEIARYTAGQRPGADTSAVVNADIAVLRKQGATVSTPKAGNTLLLKDAAGKVYSLPTTSYDYSKEGRHATMHFSFAVMKGSDRVQVSRQCSNMTGPVDAKALAVVDAAAAHITVVKH